MLVFGIICLVFTTASTLVFSSILSGFYGDPEQTWFGIIPSPMLFGSLTMAVISLIPIIIGLVFLVKGSKYASIKKKGRKSECRIHNIINVRSGYQMIVRFRGESGKEYMHEVSINYHDAALLKPDMILECYVLKEDCYIDEQHINILSDEEM